MRNLAVSVLFGALMLAQALSRVYGQAATDPSSEIASAIRQHQYELALKLGAKFSGGPKASVTEPAPQCEVLGPCRHCDTAPAPRPDR